MSKPVELPDDLVRDARRVGKLMNRSLAGQVEFWAKLGRALEALLGGEQAVRLCRSAAAQPLSSCLESVDSPRGQKRLETYLRAQPFPHYEAHPTRAGCLVRTEANGKRTVGRFVNRTFQSAAR